MKGRSEVVVWRDCCGILSAHAVKCVSKCPFCGISCRKARLEVRLRAEGETGPVLGQKGPKVGQKVSEFGPRARKVPRIEFF